MAPKHQPTALKMLKGNPGKRPLKKDEVQPDISIPTVPPHLNDVARREWKRISVVLFNLRLLSEIDRTALAAYCQTYGRWVKSENEIKKKGMVVTTINGNMIQSPWVGIANKALQLMHKYLTEFGMTPSARAGLKIGGEKTQGKPEDEFFT